MTTTHTDTITTTDITDTMGTMVIMVIMVTIASATTIQAAESLDCLTISKHIHNNIIRTDTFIKVTKLSEKNQNSCCE